MIHIEPLNLGLANRVDASLLNAGELQETLNARYAPGDPAIRPAEGRQLATELVGAYGNVLFALEWDSEVSYNGKSGYTEIYWLQRFAGPGKGAEMRATIFDPDPGQYDAQTNGTLKFSASSTEADAVLLTQPDITQFEGAYYLADGKLRQATVNGPLNFLSIPRNDTFIPILSKGPLTGALEPGRYWYWMTYKNLVTGAEGTTSSDATAQLVVLNSTPINSINIFVRADDPGLPLDGLTQVNIYRSAGVSNVNSINQWPHGRIVDTWIPGFEAAQSGAEWQAAGEDGSVVLTPSDIYYRLSFDVLSDTEVEQGDINDEQIGKEFDLLTVIVDGKETSIGRKGPAPAGTTITVFDGSLVSNNSTAGFRRQIQYTWDAEVHEWPELYVLNFDSETYDEVIKVQGFGRVMGVFLRDKVWRVNWLPRASDSEFQRGRVKELVVNEHGIESRDVITQMTLPGVGPILAWFTGTDLLGSDLFTWRNLAPHVALPSGALTLINNPSEWRLELYYPTEIYFFHYHEANQNNGRLVVTGPIQRPNGIAAITLATSRGIRQVLTLDPADNLLYESMGNDDAGTNLAFRVKSRELYVNGLGNEFKTSKMYVHQQPPGGASGAQVVQMESGPSTTRGFRYEFTPPNVGLRLKSVPAHVLGEYVTLAMGTSPTDPTSGFNWLGFQWESLGEEER